MRTYTTWRELSSVPTLVIVCLSKKTRSQAVDRIADRTTVPHSRLSSNKRMLLNSIFRIFQILGPKRIGVMTFQGYVTSSVMWPSIPHTPFPIYFFRQFFLVRRTVKPQYVTDGRRQHCSISATISIWLAKNYTTCVKIDELVIALLIVAGYCSSYTVISITS